MHTCTCSDSNAMCIPACRYLITRLQELQASFPRLIGDVRGLGLFVGFELVTDSSSKTPAPMVAKAIKEGAKARRVLLTTDGPAANVIKIKPPMVFGKREVDTMVEVLRCVAAVKYCMDANLQDLLLAGGSILAAGPQQQLSCTSV